MIKAETFSMIVSKHRSLHIASTKWLSLCLFLSVFPLDYKGYTGGMSNTYFFLR